MDETANRTWSVKSDETHTRHPHTWVEARIFQARSLSQRPLRYASVAIATDSED